MKPSDTSANSAASGWTITELLSISRFQRFVSHLLPAVSLRSRGAYSVPECVLFFQFSVCAGMYDQSERVRAARGPFHGLRGSRSVKLVDITPLGLITDIISFLAGREETTGRANCSLISSVFFFFFHFFPLLFPLYFFLPSPSNVHQL